ncbi:MAG: hypothetical protein IPL95_01635 [Saprospiraceae bacterium]|nr:hypothetical protein [Saprospiraceae bacterium]
MKKITFCLALFCAMFLSLNSLKAQDYKSAIGLRLGIPLSVSYKHFINDRGAIEATVGYKNYSGFASYFSVTAAYQYHNDISSVSGLKWYYGGGAGVNVWTYDPIYKALGVNTSSTTISIFGQLGLDYKFADYPVNLSLDWAPTFIVGSSYINGFGAGYGALSARYTF